MALVLVRKHGESLMIGDDIKITLSGNFTGQVKVAVEAPKNIAVHREEVFDRIHRQQGSK